MKTITLDQALNSDACYTADQIKALFGKRKQLSVKQIAALRIPDADKVWALTHPHFLDDKKTAVRFAVFCAEQCLDIFERQFPDDKRPRLAIEAAKAVTENDTAENRAAWAAWAAWDAARAAWAAAWDARDAASAAAWDARAAASAAASAARAASAAAWDARDAAWDARAAAWDAARNAARAAWAAASAAWDAASAAAWDAQVKHLVKLLTEKK